MNKNVRIVKANPGDELQLSELGGTTFYETFRPYNTESDIQQYIASAYNPEVIVSKLNDPEIYYALGYADNQPAGYIKLLLSVTYPGLKGNVAELEKIYVKKEFWDSGTGAALMIHAIDVCRKLGIKCLFLGVWQENVRAVSFYKKFGFEVFDTRKFQLGTRWCDDYMMKLLL